MRRIFPLLFFLVSLPAAILLSEYTLSLIGQAAPVPANPIFDANSTGNEIKRSWNNFSQGGEETSGMLSAVKDKMREISPRYIRIDHIYDFYAVVSDKDGIRSYDFSRLDKTVDDILATGATPFFSLSYMPSSLSGSGSIIDKPRDWKDWENLVKETIQHYSGKNQRNLNKVYYEVWNEPELEQFGKFQLAEPKDYRILYFHSVNGAKRTENTNEYFIGGPAIGSYYPDWIKGFLSYVSQNRLRLDFFSWHRYHQNPEIFSKDAKAIRNDLSNYRDYASIPIILSEWGMESGNSEINSSNQAAAHNISSAIKFNDYIDLALNFEIKDGPPPDGGKWGILNHERDNPSLFEKPRYHAFFHLNMLSGQKITMSGKGTYVDGIASKDGDIINAMLVNYDRAGKNTENVPLTITGLEPYSYQLEYKYIFNSTSGSYEIPSTDGIIRKDFIMPPNSVLFIRISKNAPLSVSTSTSKEAESSDLLSSSNPYVIRYPDFYLAYTGTISFDMKKKWSENDKDPKIILEAPYLLPGEKMSRLQLLRQYSDGQDRLVFTSGQAGKEHIVESENININDREWERITLGWNSTGIYISAGGKQYEKNFPADIRNGKLLTFYNNNIILGKVDISIANRFFYSKNYSN